MNRASPLLLRSDDVVQLLLHLLVRGERVVQFGDALFKLVHRQHPVLVEERRHGPCELCFPEAPGLPVGEGDSERVLVVKPFEGGRELPGVIRVHPGRVLVQSHKEDVLLLVRGVERQYSHHDEVRDDAAGQDGPGLRERVQKVPDQRQHGEEAGDCADQQATIDQLEVLHVAELLQQHLQGAQQQAEAQTDKSSGSQTNYRRDGNVPPLVFFYFL